MNDNDLGSAQVGFEVDLKDLQRQLSQAARMIGQVESQSQKATNQAGKRGGLFGALLGNTNQAGFGISLLSNFQGSLGRVGTAVSGVGRLFSSMGGSAAAAGVSLGAVIGVAAAVGVAIAALIITVKAVTLAFDQMKQSLAAAGDQQAINTTFTTMVENLGIAEGQVNSFRKELAKLSYTEGEQTQIMQGLIQSMGANGLSKEALAAAQAMRDLSVAGGVSSKEGIALLNQAITTLNPQLLQNFGLTQTATQVFDAYGATINKSAQEMSTTEKQQAILNAVMERGAASAGLADRAQNDLNRTATRLKDNFRQLQAGVGQVFLPLASGILSAINTEVFGLSSAVADNSAKFQELGNRLANAVIPTVQKVIAWFKALPWAGIVDGIYRVIQAFQIQARVTVFVWQSLVNGVKFGIGALRLVGAGIGVVIGAFKVAASVVSNFWKVLTGKQDLGQALSNIGNTASNEIVKSFDNVMGALGSMVDASEDQFNAITGFFKGVGQDISQIIKGFNVEEWWAGLPAGVAAAGDEALKNFATTGEGMGKEALKALRKMQEDLAKENADYARAQAKAAKDFEESLAELTAQHRDRIKSIRDDIAKESREFEKAQSERTKTYQDELARLNKADSDRKKDVETQLAEEMAKGRFADQTKIASLRARLQYEDAAHQEAVQKAEQKYNEDTTNAKDAHNERLSQLQVDLDKELAIQAKHAADFARYRDYQIKDDITKLKEKYAEQRAEDARAHQERLADIIKRGTEEARQNAQNGANNANAYNGALGAGLKGGAPGLNSLANANAKGLMDSANNGVESKRGSWWDKIKSVVSTGLDRIGDFFGTARQWGSNLIGKVTDGIWGMANAVKEAVVGMFGRAVGAVGSLTDFGRQLIGKAGSGIKSVLGSVGGAFQSAWNAAGLPRFAHGGIVGGRAGVDTNVAAVTRGEMILNRDQQARMFQLLNGNVAPSNNAGSSNAGIIIENLSLSLPSVRNATDFERELQLKFQTMRLA